MFVHWRSIKASLFVRSCQSFNRLQAQSFLFPSSPRLLFTILSLVRSWYYLFKYKHGFRLPCPSVAALAFASSNGFWFVATSNEQNKCLYPWKEWLLVCLPENHQRYKYLQPYCYLLIETHVLAFIKINMLIRVVSLMRTQFCCAMLLHDLSQGSPTSGSWVTNLFETVSSLCTD